MSTVTGTLHQRARTVFSDLGYVTSGDGRTFRAERKWRIVHVTPMPEPEAPPDSGDLRCFVTWVENLAAVERRLEAAAPDYEWALIGVDGDGYVVRQCPSDAPGGR
ncbi:DUF7116 family protein [Salinirussus salinus]|uniref:DUF7116 family protein n=1 Tax=Salinirussus salinus TaxID=1198300 RepID=UPI00135CE4EA|nr:hypothetical protein [Salinirussus salinus]